MRLTDHFPIKKKTYRENHANTSHSYHQEYRSEALQTCKKVEEQTRKYVVWLKERGTEVHRSDPRISLKGSKIELQKQKNLEGATPELF